MSRYRIWSGFRLVDPDPDRTLDRVRAVAVLLDDAIEIPRLGIRIGIDPIVGVLPIAGDVVTGLMSVYIIVEGIRLGLPRRALLRMLLNVLVDTGVGSLPVIGSIFDVVWRSNRRNVAIIERHVRA
ncbi:MAG: DUF4112 domain-containing protein [Halobacteriales archaeon]